MDREYPCDIMMDLLPGYIDGILSETGTKVVKEHLEKCGECRLSHEAMAEKMREELEAGIIPREQDAIDGFKKLRRRTRKWKMAAGALTGLLLLVFMAVLIKVYVIGNIMSGGPVEITDYSYDEETGSLVLNGRLDMTGYRVSRVVCKESEEEPFVQNVFVYAAETLPFLSDGQEQAEFSVTVPDAKGCVVYQAWQGYNRRLVYHWKHDHNEKLMELEAEIYSRVPGLDQEKDALGYFKGMETVEGKDGIAYDVTTMIGEDAYYWWFNDQLAMYGDFKTLDLDIWISLEEPYQILIYDYRTGQYTENLSVVGDRKKEAQPEDLQWLPEKQ